MSEPLSAWSFDSSGLTGRNAAPMRRVVLDRHSRGATSCGFSATRSTSPRRSRSRRYRYVVARLAGDAVTTASIPPPSAMSPDFVMIDASQYAHERTATGRSAAAMSSRKAGRTSAGRQFPGSDARDRSLARLVGRIPRATRRPIVAGAPGSATMKSDSPSLVFGTRDSGPGSSSRARSRPESSLRLADATSGGSVNRSLSPTRRAR